MHAPLLALLSLVPAHAPSVDDLPIDTWVDRVEELDAITFRYRVVSAEGEELFFDLALGGPTRARLDIEDGVDRIRVWVEDGVMTTLMETEGESGEAFSADFGAAAAEPRDWLSGAVQAVGLPEIELPSPRAQFIVWPVVDGEGTWNLQLTVGVTARSPFVWLERLRSTEHLAESTDDGWVAHLDDGTEFLLDETYGFVRRVVIDPQELEAGLIELVEVEVGVELAAATFTPDVPDDADDTASGDLMLRMERELWKNARFQWARAVVRAEREEAGFFAENEDALDEHMGKFYVLCFATRTEAVMERIEAFLDDRVDQLFAVWERSTDREADRPRFEAAKKQIAEVLASDTLELAEDFADQYVVRPGDTEDAELDMLMEIERRAAIRAIQDALHVPSKKHLDERLAEQDDDGGQR